MKTFFIKHKRQIIRIILILIIARGTSRDFGTTENILKPHENSSITSYTITGFDNISGILLNGPSIHNRPQREHYMSLNKSQTQGWIYDITYKNAKARMNASNKNTPLTLIVEQDKYQQFADDLGNLQKEFANNTNITLLSDRNLGINNMHAKTFFGEQRRVIQTANLNRSSFESNREHFFLSTDPTIRQNLQDLFDLDIQTIKTKKKDKKAYLTLTDRMSPNLLVCPLNCRQKLESLINSAKKSIRISAQYITDDHIIELLRNKSQLDLRILTNNMQSNNEIVRYFGNKVVRFEPKKQYNHDKMMIIDQQIMLVGSMNFSQNALDNNREIGIVLLDPHMIQQQQKLFE